MIKLVIITIMHANVFYVTIVHANVFYLQMTAESASRLTLGLVLGNDWLGRRTGRERGEVVGDNCDELLVGFCRDNTATCINQSKMF